MFVQLGPRPQDVEGDISGLHGRLRGKDLGDCRADRVHVAHLVVRCHPVKQHPGRPPLSVHLDQPGAHRGLFREQAPVFILGGLDVLKQLIERFEDVGVKRNAQTFIGQRVDDHRPAFVNRPEQAVIGHLHILKEDLIDLRGAAQGVNGPHRDPGGLHVHCKYREPFVTLRIRV